MINLSGILQMNLKNYIREIPDFPITGINFKDITTLLKNANAFEEAIQRMADSFENDKPKVIVAIESRGFIFGAALANFWKIAFVPARKPNKLPAEKLREEYQLEYGTDSIEIHRDSIVKGQGVLIVDDLLATGGTAAAACRLVEKLGGKVIGVVCLIELTFLKGRDKLKPYRVISLIQYDSE
jgi:adenine phosphoribosyltransferase